MAQVPDFGLPTAKEQPLSSARHESIATPDLLDAGAVEQGKFGTALMAAGTGAEQIGYHMQQREDADRVFAAESNDKAAYLAYEADLRQNRLGANAKGASTDTAAWWKDRISKNTQGMTDEQQRLYVKRAVPVQFQSISNVSTFEANQLEISHDQSWTADKVNTINLAAATPTPGNIATSVGQLKKFNSYQGARKGWTPEILQAENVKDITSLHQQAIQTLAKDNPTMAAAYFKEHELEIAGSQRAEIGKFAEQATAARIGADAAQAEWTANGPKGDKDASSIDTMKANIRERLKNDPYSRDAALTEISQIDADRDKAIRARDSQRVASVNSMLLGGANMAAVQQTPEWAALDGTQQRSVTEHEKSLLLAKESELTLAGMGKMMELSDPDKLVALDRNDIINLRPVIGNRNAESLLNKWDTLTKNGTLLSEAKLDNDQFNSFATRAGLDVKSKDSTVQKQVIDTRDRVERMIGAEQQAKKRPLTRDEKDKILQQQLDNTVIQHNTFLRDEPKPLVATPYDKLTDAYVMVNGERIKLSAIPADYRAELTAARRARGLPTSEKTIAEMWQKRQAAKKKAQPEVEPEAATPMLGN